MWFFSVLLYSKRYTRVRHYPTREAAMRVMCSARFAKAALASGFTEWEMMSTKLSAVGGAA